MAGNTTPIGINPPDLTDLRVVHAATNKTGIFLTLQGVLTATYPDGACRIQAPVEFKVAVKDWQSQPVNTALALQEASARMFLDTRIVRRSRSTLTLSRVYAAYMHWGGSATRAVFHKVLRDDFSHYLQPKGGVYTAGVEMVMKGYGIRAD